MANSDLGRYNDAWRQVLHTESGAVAQLGRTWATVMTSRPKHERGPRARARAQSPNRSRYSLLDDEEQQANKVVLLPANRVLREVRQAANTLSKLFDEADDINPILQNKAEEWAKSPSVKGLPTGSVSRGKNGGDIPVKTVKRAFQKIYRSYGGDFSCLCDLVRTSIVFNNVQSLTECFEAIASDPDVVLIYQGDHKFRLRRDYDADQSCGYRDLQLSVRIDNDVTRMLGISKHVCEVQLHLDTILTIKSDEGHAMYKKLRNMIGE